jgi:hypothetical protein
VLEYGRNFSPRRQAIGLARPSPLPRRVPLVESTIAATASTLTVILECDMRVSLVRSPPCHCQSNGEQTENGKALCVHLRRTKSH